MKEDHWCWVTCGVSVESVWEGDHRKANWSRIESLADHWPLSLYVDPYCPWMVFKHLLVLVGCLGVYCSVGWSHERSLPSFPYCEHKRLAAVSSMTHDSLQCGASQAWQVAFESGLWYCTCLAFRQRTIDLEVPFLRISLGRSSWLDFLLVLLPIDLNQVTGIG